MASALPLNPHTLDNDALRIYEGCRQFQDDTETEEHTIYARILGYMVLHAPSPQVAQELEKVISSCEGDYTALCDLGQAFMNYFIRPFKKPKERTPPSSYHTGRPKFDDKKYQLSDIVETPRNHKEAKRQALIRDGFRCIVTGKYDADAIKIPEIGREEVIRVGGLHTECAHIFPDSTYFNVSTSSDKKDYSASVLAVLKGFGFDLTTVNGEKFHSLFNVMTVEKNVHDWFERLELWFEATPTEHCYRLKTADQYIHVPEMITLTSSDPTRLTLPSPKVLALHATCANVAHLSGARDYIDKLDEDLDCMGVLGYDGGSSELLTHALLRSRSRTPICNRKLEL